ncbi:4-hydroxy-tetrahydrodipicolinate synthase [Evansella caseinilytica]|uniref:4-hydroxy-tetrahydrodipicolinate synthase n=1 Tax=Evansella caseinilytica TaxID=1503961 RepID=A0A1H3UUE5_9BACI|nr:4-hydroxy-tetrahydrodipicolinate synthase [Evansella caseinilytica]SDZ65651.1 4-hydroxy-tetrahydrodipicolinate synthase [Evansella caseinilytica]
MQLTGIITAMVTPFDDNQKIDVPATKALVNQLIRSHVNGLFILGTNGEFHVMARDEKIQFAKIVIEETNKRVPVCVGVGGNSTREVVELSKAMTAIGADVLSVITPFFISLTEEELYHHYAVIAASVSLPIVLYNMPKNTGINISTDLVKRMAKIPNIIGIKDSSGDIANIKSYIEATKKEDFVVLSGSDSLILKALDEGAAGAIAATSNILTNINVSIYQHWLKKEKNKAEEAQQSLEELRGILKLASIPAVLKKAMAIAGTPVGPARYPVLPPSEAAIQEIEAAVKAYQKKHAALAN